MKSARRWLTSFLFFCSMGFPCMLRAGPIQWTIAEGGNGDWYDLVMPNSHKDSYSWIDARAAADSMTFDGLPGYLATVTSPGESEFLRVNFSSELSDNPSHAKYAWIGLFAPTPTSNFQWVTGEPLNYTDWAPGEPNFFGTPLWQFVHYWTRDFGSGPTWTWNNEQDLPGRNTYGFFIEFGGGQDLGEVPEPPSFTLVMISALTFLGYGSRRRLGGVANRTC